MTSIAQRQFPIIRWQHGEKHLWNPVHRKVLKNRPEERVRLRVIEYLLEAGWSRYRVTTEEAIKGLEQEAGLRTDVICYSQEFEPRILIECKAESVPISAKTAEQIARYNQHVQAPFLLLSNGYQDYWYSIETSDRRVRPLSGVPDFIKPGKKQISRDYDYWKQRGFAGDQARPPLRRWLERALTCFDDPQFEKTYLQFRRSPEGLDLDHYYSIKKRGNQKVAFTFINTFYGGSRIIGVVNEGGQNRAVVEVNLDLIFQNEAPNTTLYSSEGVVNMDLRPALEESLQGLSRRAVTGLPGMFSQVVEEHLS